MRCRTLVLILSGFLVMIATVRAEDPARESRPATACNHGGYDMWDVLRMLPVTFTEFNGNTAHWKYQNSRTVKLGSFVLSERAQYISREEKEVSVSYVIQRKDSGWLCYYCSQCYGLLRAYELKRDASGF